jgi:hypothetical protein
VIVLDSINANLSHRIKEHKLKTHTHREREKRETTSATMEKEIASIISSFFCLEGLIVQKPQLKESGNRKPR